MLGHRIFRCAAISRTPSRPMFTRLAPIPQETSASGLVQGVHRLVGSRYHGDAPSLSAQVDQASRLIEALGMAYPAFMLTKGRCLPCVRAKKLLRDLGVRCQIVQLDGLTPEEKLAMQAHVKAATGAGSVPRVYIGGKCVGGYGDLRRQHWAGELMPMLVAAGVTEAGSRSVQGQFFESGNPLL